MTTPFGFSSEPPGGDQTTPLHSFANPLDTVLNARLRGQTNSYDSSFLRHQIHLEENRPEPVRVEMQAEVVSDHPSRVASSNSQPLWAGAVLFIWIILALARQILLAMPNERGHLWPMLIFQVVLGIACGVAVYLDGVFPADHRLGWLPPTIVLLTSGIALIALYVWFML